MRMRKILLTGASGFIGSTLAEQLEKKGHDVYGLYRYVSDGRYDYYQLERKLMGDLRDESAMDNIVKQIEPDVIIHLGAITPVSYSFVYSTEVTEVDYIGTVNISNAALNYGVEQFIFASTSEVYGTQTKLPTPEDVRLHPDSPYAVAKVAAEEYLRQLDTVHGFNYTIIRPFNSYGRANVRKKYFVVERAITQALETGHINLYNSKPKRVFMFRDDHVDGYMKAIGNKKAYKQIINLSTDECYSIAEMTEVVADIIEEKTGKRPSINFDERPDRPYEIPVLWGTNNKAKKLLGWEPKYDLRSGIKKAVDEWMEVLK
jgi:nucleoside-diphosphate-sugar epimerase